MALYLKMPLILLIIALIPVAETLSVVLQVTYFKATGGKRLLKNIISIKNLWRGKKKKLKDHNFTY